MANGELPHHHSPHLAATLVSAWLVGTMVIWWLAFSGGPELSSDWLQRARVVCFGMDESGLPNGGGWITLTLAPLSLLAALIISLPTEMSALRSTLRRHPIGRITVILVGLAIAVELSWAGKRIYNGVTFERIDFASSTSEETLERYPRRDVPAPPFELQNALSEKVSLSSLSGKGLILTFAFAHCRTICPALIATSKSALRGLPMEKVHLIIITLDPRRDTVRSLPQAKERWELPRNSDILTGEVALVEEVIARYEIPTVRDERNGDITHPGLILVIDPEGTIAYTFNNPSPELLRQALERTIMPVEGEHGNG